MHVLLYKNYLLSYPFLLVYASKLNYIDIYQWLVIYFNLRSREQMSRALVLVLGAYYENSIFKLSAADYDMRTPAKNVKNFIKIVRDCISASLHHFHFKFVCFFFHCLCTAVVFNFALESIFVINMYVRLKKGSNRQKEKCLILCSWKIFS